MVTKPGHFTYKSCVPPGEGGSATAAGRVHLYLLIRTLFTGLANKSGLLVSGAVETGSTEVR